MRVVSVGCSNAIPERISNKTGLVDWALKILNLNSKVKRHTMDYMLSNILLFKNNKTNPFKKFSIEITES